MFKLIIRWIAKANPAKRLPGGHYNTKKNTLVIEENEAGTNHKAAIEASKSVLGIGRRVKVSKHGNKIAVFCTR